MPNYTEPTERFIDSGDGVNMNHSSLSAMVLGVSTLVSACVCGSAMADDDADVVPQYESDDIVVVAASANEPLTEYSAEAAGAYLDQGATAWSRERQCVSCHTNGTYMWIRPQLTESLGPPREEIRTFFAEQLAEMQDSDVSELQNGANPAALIYLTAGLAEWDTNVSGQPSEETRAALQLMLSLQQDDGTWHSMDCWPPFESSVYQVATMAAMALSGSPGLTESLTDDDSQTRIERLRQYLRDTEPPHDYARVLRLWTSMQFSGIISEQQRTEVLAVIREKQRDDGGWSLRDFATPEEWGSGNRAERLQAEVDEGAITSDGHMTGLALIVLQLADREASQAAVEKGTAWLRSNQRQSGRWWTRSLNTDDWHFITFSGTAYPLLAMQLLDEQ